MSSPLPFAGREFKTKSAGEGQLPNQFLTGRREPDAETGTGPVNTTETGPVPVSSTSESQAVHRHSQKGRPTR